MTPPLIAALTRILDGRALDVTLADGTRYEIGPREPDRHVPAMRLTDAAAERLFLIDPELRMGELYMDERLLVDRGDLCEVLTALFAGGRSQPLPVAARMLASARDAWRRLTRNSRERAAVNVAHHYDIDERLYRLFLDEDLQYSCAYFEHAAASLEEAQQAKKRHIAAKLLLEPGHRVLDIGCGWGGLALYLAGDGGGADVTGVTLSKGQARLAAQHVAGAGLQDRVEIALKDYRDVEGEFDRIVSVGMFEHVGRRDYDAFFSTCRGLLRDDGVMLLHTIMTNHPPAPANPWVDKYIFPGGVLPSLAEVVAAIERADLVIADIEVLRLHYAQTLRHWRARFEANREEAERLYDARFCRMWEFYLAASEATFRSGYAAVAQIQIAHRQDAVPLTRDYLGKREAELAAKATPGAAGVEMDQIARRPLRYTSTTYRTASRAGAAAGRARGRDPAKGPKPTGS